MEEAILSSLKSQAGRDVSGEELSRIVGVSRTAIWKEIRKLRAQGYKILAQPHTGYRLVGTPDRLIPQELTWNLSTTRIGRRIHAYESTDSTMDIAHRLAAAGEPEGSVVVAEGQTKGRGRMGRNWLSPRAKGIYLSVILRPKLKLTELSHLTLMTAVAVAQAVESHSGVRPEIKWPNDLLIRGKKLAGILTELNAELNRVNFCVVGLGLNVNSSRSQLPAHGTSLSEEAGRRIDRVSLTRALLKGLDRSYGLFLSGGVDPLLEQWRGYASFLGRRIRVVISGRTVDGQAVDIDSDGTLLVRTDTGFVESVSAGEVLVVR